MTKKKEDSNVKIIGSKSIEYTFLDNDLLNLKSTTISQKNDGDNNRNNVIPNDSKINKDIQRIRQNDLQFTKSRYKVRTTGGQSKQSHSSVYE